MSCRWDCNGRCWNKDVRRWHACRSSMQTMRTKCAEPKYNVTSLVLSRCCLLGHVIDGLSHVTCQRCCHEDRLGRPDRRRPWGAGCRHESRRAMRRLVSGQPDCGRRRDSRSVSGQRVAGNAMPPRRSLFGSSVGLAMRPVRSLRRSASAKPTRQCGSIHHPFATQTV